jgi:hypothetical protein
VSIQGWLVQLPLHGYSTPPRCASCCGPKETEVFVQTTEKQERSRVTLTMGFPYCLSCAKRLAHERLRGALVIAGSLVIGVALALAFAFANVLVGLAIRAAIAAVLGVAAALALALATRPPLPPPPASARGDAVILRGTSGLVLCTNQEFAQSLAQANRTVATPGSKWMTSATWAVFAVLLGGGAAIAAFTRLAPASSFDPSSDVAAPSGRPAPLAPSPPRPRR